MVRKSGIVMATPRSMVDLVTVRLECLEAGVDFESLGAPVLADTDRKSLRSLVHLKIQDSRSANSSSACEIELKPSRDSRVLANPLFSHRQAMNRAPWG